MQALQNERTVTQAANLTLAVIAAVLSEVHDGAPDRARIGELAQEIAVQERWSGVSREEVASLLQGITTGSPVRLAEGGSSARVPFVVAAHLLAAASQPDEGEWWFNYLDPVEAAIEAAG